MSEEEKMKMIEQFLKGYLEPLRPPTVHEIIVEMAKERGPLMINDVIARGGFDDGK